MARLFAIVGLMLVFVAGCAQQVPEASVPIEKKASVTRIECDLFRREITGRSEGTNTHWLFRREQNTADCTTLFNSLRMEQALAGSKLDTALRIEVTFVESQNGADVYRVNYQLTTGTKESAKEFEIRYTGKLITAIDDEYGQLEFRPRSGDL